MGHVGNSRAEFDNIFNNSGDVRTKKTFAEIARIKTYMH